MSRSTEGKLIDIPLGSGMNQAGGTRGAAPGSLEYATNSRIRAAGRIERRCGNNAIAALSKGGGGGRAVSDSAAIPRPTEHPAFITSSAGESIIGTTAGDVFSYRGSQSGFHEFRGCFSAAKPVGRTAQIGSANPAIPIVGVPGACAVTSTGYKLVASVNGASELLWVILDPLGVVIYRGEGITVTLGTMPRAVVQGTQLILVYHLDGGLIIKAIAHNIATGTVVAAAAATVLTLQAATSNWDTSSYDSSQWLIVGRTGPSITEVTLASVNITTVGITTTFASTGEIRLSVWGDATHAHAWVGYLNDPTGGASARVGFTTYSVTAPAFVLVYALTSILAPPDINSNAGPPLFGPRYTRDTLNSDTFFIVQSTVGSIQHIRYGYVVSGIPTAAPYTQNHIIPVSKPDLQQRFWAIQQPHTETLPGQYLLLRFSEPTTTTSPTLTVELATPLDVGHYISMQAWLYVFHAVAVQSEDAGGKTYMALPFSLTTLSTDASSGHVTLATLFLYEYERYNQAPTVGYTGGDELILAGQPTSLGGVAASAGLGTYYGGVGAFEFGIPLAPTILSATAAAGGSGLVAGTYQYVALHQWTDRFGRRHISPPSAPVTVTTTAPESNVTVLVTDCTLGQRQVANAQRVITVLYRTTAGGEIPQLIADGEPPAAAGVVTFVDADTGATENEFIPTAGGVLPVQLAPSCRYVRQAEERLWVGGLWDRNIIEASRIRVPGEPYHFTQDPSHQVVLPGDCTGLAYQDGQVVAFTERAVYLIGGDGPNDQGAGSFLPPRAYVANFGCPDTESGSILETEVGIFFRSASTWWIIPRGFGTPVDIGAPIQDESAHCIASAYTETAGFRLARFLVGSADDYSSDTVLVYHLENNQWTRDVFAADIGTIGQWPDGLAMFRYDLDRVTATGAVANVIRYEQESVGADYDGTITQAIRTNWQYPFGPGGWGAVKKVLTAAESLSAGGEQTLTITVETDSNTYTPTAWQTLGSEDPVYRGIDVKVTRCTCYRVTVQQSAEVPNLSGAYGDGLRFLSITAEVDTEQGVRLLAASGQKV